VPEVNEEVLVSFEGGNGERPYVSGTFFNGKDHPDEKWYPGENEVKALRTRNGHTIEVHDKGKGGYIKIYDNKKNNYVITFSTDRKLIRLQSSGNIELDAANDIIMHAGRNIDIQADKDMYETVGENHETNTLGDDKNKVIGRFTLDADKSAEMRGGFRPGERNDFGGRFYANDNEVIISGVKGASLLSDERASVSGTHEASIHSLGEVKVQADYETSKVTISGGEVTIN
jgi:uncharacterized protein involved in type VI secretion and phage assembly